MDERLGQNDAELIRSCVDRDASAWEIFIKKYSRLIVVSAGYRLRKYSYYPSSDDLDEIKQEVLSLLWDGGKLAEIRNPSSLRYWLGMVSGNMAIQYLRRKRRASSLFPVSMSDKVDGIEMAEILPSTAPTPAEAVDSSEFSEQLEKAIAALPMKEGLSLKLNLLYGKSHKDISVIMSMPMGTVCSYIKRAKEKLRKALSDYR